LILSRIEWTVVTQWTVCHWHLWYIGLKIGLDEFISDVVSFFQLLDLLPENVLFLDKSRFFEGRWLEIFLEVLNQVVNLNVLHFNSVLDFALQNKFLDSEVFLFLTNSFEFVNLQLEFLFVFFHVGQLSLERVFLFLILNVSCVLFWLFHFENGFLIFFNLNCEKFHLVFDWLDQVFVWLESKGLLQGWCYCTLDTLNGLDLCLVELLNWFGFFLWVEEFLLKFFL
jgi:hypothetical protein